MCEKVQCNVSGSDAMCQEVMQCVRKCNATCPGSDAMCEKVQCNVSGSDAMCEKVQCNVSGCACRITSATVPGSRHWKVMPQPSGLERGR